MASNLAPFAMVPRDLIAQVTPRALQVWCCLCQWTDREESTTQPSHARIAREIGASTDVVKRAIAELEKTGRLQKISGKAKGKTNKYRTILTRLDGTGSAKTPYPSRKNALPPLKEVNQEVLTNTPLTPQGVEAVELQQQFEKLCTTYPKQRAPRKDKFAQAWPEYQKLTAQERTEAQAAAETLATIHAAAPEGRQQMTPQLKKWIAEKRWNYHPADVEAHYHVNGLLAEIREERARKAANQRMREEQEQWEREARNQRA